jgi:hypothetical protein
MTAARYDDSEWPLVIVTMPKSAMSRDEFEAHLARIGSYYPRGAFGLLVDTRDAFPLDANQRRMVADEIELNEVRYPRTMLGCAVVMTSAVQRGVLRAIKWLTSPKFEMEPFADVAEARTWLRTKIGASRARATRSA